MNVEIKIGEPIVSARRSQYELVVDYMHGDADADTVESFFFTDVERLKKYLCVAKALYDLEDSDEDLEEVEGLDEKEADNIASDLYVGDATCEGRGAAVTDYNVFWYDEHGVKHEVEVDFK